jgi:hypothetical protein
VSQMGIRMTTHIRKCSSWVTAQSWAAAAAETCCQVGLLSLQDGRSLRGLKCSIIALICQSVEGKRATGMEGLRDSPPGALLER